MSQQGASPGTTKVSGGKGSRRRQPYAWLGAGLLSVGVGAALAGAGVAAADSAPAEGSASSPSSSAAGSAAKASRTAAHRTASTETRRLPRVRAGAIASVSAPTLGVPSVPVAAATVSPPARLSRGVTARVQVAAPAEVAAPAQPGYAWSPNPVTLPGQRPNPLLAQLGPVGNAIVKLAFLPRNEFLYHRFDLKPKATPFTAPEAPDSTAVHGTLNAHTQFGGPISVEVMTEPTNGTVTLTDDGFFKYTPDEALAGTPGADTFTAKVTDVSYHLGKVIGKIFGIPDRSTTVDVPVSWDSLTPPPLGGSEYKNYHIHNYTGYELYVSNSDLQSTVVWPVNGTVINQGDEAYVQMEYCGCQKDKESTFYFNFAGPGAAGVSAPLDYTQYAYKVNTKIDYENDVVADQAVQKTSCAAYSGTCDPDNDGNVYLYDSPGTTFNLSGNTAGEIDIQNSVINAFVADEDEPSNVDFLNPTQSFGYTPLQKIPGLNPQFCIALATCTIDTVSSSSVSSTLGHSQTVGVTVEVGTPKTYWINFQVGASYDYEWDESVSTESTNQFSFSETLSATAPFVTNVGYTLYPFQASPVIYTSGTTTVTIWNDTYNLYDTWYTFPAYNAGSGYQPYPLWFACPTNGAACQSMNNGFVPAGTNAMTNGNDKTDRGYQECSTDCDYPYQVTPPGQDITIDPVTGLTVYYYVPDSVKGITYFLTTPLGTTVSDNSTD